MNDISFREHSTKHVCKKQITSSFFLRNKVHITARQQVEYSSNILETTYALPERTNRGPPTNKYISVRNIKAQITNMSVNKNAGFKSEYQVKIDILFTHQRVKIIYVRK